MSEADGLGPDISEETTISFSDRINYPYILGRSFLTYLIAITNNPTAFTRQQVEEAAKAINTLIPDGMGDKQYRDDIAKARVKTTYDARPLLCGVPMGELVTTELDETDYYALVHAAVNLLYRSEMLTRRTVTEKRRESIGDYTDTGQDR